MYYSASIKRESDRRTCWNFNARKRTKALKAPKFNTNPGAQIHLKLCKGVNYHVHVPHFPHLLEILPDVSHRFLLFWSETALIICRNFPKWFRCSLRFPSPKDKISSSNTDLGFTWSYQISIAVTQYFWSTEFLKNNSYVN